MGKKPKIDIPPGAMVAQGVTGIAIFDGAYVTLHRTGTLARMTVGKGDKRIPIRSISAIQFKPAGPVVSGMIEFSIPGGNEAKSQFGRQSYVAAENENAMLFIAKHEPAFRAIRDAVEAAQMALHAPAPQMTAPPQPDVYQQLAQLGQLRDAGVVTPEEFEAKKRELLARI